MTLPANMRSSPSGSSANRHWSQFTFVQIVVSDLPPGTSTLDIYEYFKVHGNVSRISIFDTREDDRGSRAEIRFEPPPKTPIWEQRRCLFQSNGRTNVVRLHLSHQTPRKFTVESPVRKGVTYNEKTELTARVIRFGVMRDKQTMLSMASRGDDEHPPRLVLDLQQRAIHIFFPSRMSSETRTAYRDFRFSIALDENFTIWQLSKSEYILHLNSVPWYSKQLKEAVGQTHAPDAKRWSEEDTWARQTDIVNKKSDMQALNQLPVAVQKDLKSIDIARWTTFKIDLLETPHNMASENTFLSALKDFNVEVLKGNDIKVEKAPAGLDDDVWNLINGKRVTDIPKSLAEELLSFSLPFPVRYQLEVCISHGSLSEYSITADFLQKLAAIEQEKAKQMLVFVDSFGDRLWDPMIIFEDLRFRRPIKMHKLPSNCMEARSATVTATGVLFNTPTVEVMNRITRKYRQYADRFLRVRFEDDAYRGQTKLFAASNNKMILIFQRVKRVLRHGIKLGDVHYEFLAWGNSQLRDHGAYFFATVGNISANSIRQDMGAFDQEKVVAKRAARMGQCFSTTTPVHLQIPRVSKNNFIPDIRNDKHIFTDGVGKISRFVAIMIQQQLKLQGEPPCCFQFRLGGCKGVLVVWPGLSGIEVQIRDSQFKFDSTAGDLEIIRHSEFWQPFLNRQIIICLAHLGVPVNVFLTKQDETIKALEAALHNDPAALKALRDNVDPNGMNISMCDLVNAGFRAFQEPFVMSLIHLWRAWSLKYLKEKAKIPVSKGAFVLGCADETGTLQGYLEPTDSEHHLPLEEKKKSLPQIFIQIKNPQTGKREVITGICVLARNPSLHRGDIRVVNAVDNEFLRHLCDVVVMPTTGDRDLPSMCSGGDLDGDDYIVIWDQELLPKEWNAPPFHYEPPPARRAAKEITTEDIINFFYDYMQNDYLGRIAHAHLAAADYLDEGIDSSTCLELVQLHSMAVDYPKTGVPAIMERRLEQNQYPHFMEKKSRSYKSHKVLGQLYDRVQRVAFVPNYRLQFDNHILNAGKPTDDMMKSIEILKQEYDNAMQRIMTQHNIKTEFEVWSTFVISHSKASRDYKFHEEIGQLSRSLKEQYYLALVDLAGGKDFKQLTPVAIAAYQYTHAQVEAGLKEVDEGNRYEGSEGMPFISFPWILQDTLCQLAKTTRSTTSAPNVTIFTKGTAIKHAPVMQFNEEGHAQIEVLDELDVRFADVVNAEQHLPDPYQPADEFINDDEPDWFKDIELLENLNKLVQNRSGSIDAVQKNGEVNGETEIIKYIAESNKIQHNSQEEDAAGARITVCANAEADAPTTIQYPSNEETSPMLPGLARLKEQDVQGIGQTLPPNDLYAKSDLVRTWLADVEDVVPQVRHEDESKVSEKSDLSGSSDPRALVDDESKHQKPSEALLIVVDDDRSETEPSVDARINVDVDLEVGVKSPSVQSPPQPEVLDDPLNMTGEQMKALGFDEGIELL